MIVIAILGFSIGILGFYQIRTNTFERAQAQVTHDLAVAHAVYFGEIQQIKKVFKLVSPEKDLVAVKDLAGLDYLFLVSKADSGSLKSEIAQEVLRTGKECSGTRIIRPEELKSFGPDFQERTHILIRPTPHAAVTTRTVVDSALGLEYAMPLYDGRALKGVLFAGKIINRDFALVDKVRDIVFGNSFYDSKPVGTVTIFLDDTRITTNVLDTEGKRAIGTRVSQTVYENVVRKGKFWLDRAFVVTDWYLTGYEPLKDVHGNIIGILYVGLLEKPFNDMLRNFSYAFLVIIFIAALLAVIFSYVLAFAISRPLTDVVEATQRISEGDLGHRIEIVTDIDELNHLTGSFNAMADRLHERDIKINESTEKLETLNKSYLDLIGFVAHELKAMLSSALLNAYSVRDGFLGMINFKQRKAMDSVTRKLDYLAATVKNFLSLSRLEKGEMTVNYRDLMIKEDVFDIAVEEFSRQAADRAIEIQNKMFAGFKVSGDLDLLVIAANNLVGNAVKYAVPGGKIILDAVRSDRKVKISVYNDGEPLNAEQGDMLFKKFSRVISPVTKKVQGTGLGLYITKEIIEKHGGHIWIESNEKGNTFLFEILQGDVSC